MALPLLIVPAGGVKAVASLSLATHLFAPYESAWSWGAKLAAANALSAFEVAALLGVSPESERPLLPARLPQLAQLLGMKLALPFERIEHAFVEGIFKCLRPQICDQLRMCPVCARMGYHFIVHQIRSLTYCPLPAVPLREVCSRCSQRIEYEFGTSKVHGPINCPQCAAPQLPVTRGGCPTTGAMMPRDFKLVARWLMLLRRRSDHPGSISSAGATGAARSALPSLSAARMMPVIVPPRKERGPVASSRALWSDAAEYQGLTNRYWRHANERWLRSTASSRRWYRCLVKGDYVGPAPSVDILAFVYWRMTWQGCSNPYLLRRAHGLPLYGIAEWEAVQPVPDEDDLEIGLLAFSTALDASICVFNSIVSGSE